MVQTLFDLLPEPASRLSPTLEVREQNARSLAEHGPGSGARCHAVHFGRDAPCPGCNVQDVLRHGREGHWFLTVEGDSRPSYYEITIVPVKDDTGNVTELFEIIRDATLTLGVEQHLIRTSGELESEVADRTAELSRLTEKTGELQERMELLRNQQAAMLQTEKMASLGSLAAGLTHEIHTPLGALISNLDMLRRSLARIEADKPGSGTTKQLVICRRLLDLQEQASGRIHKIIGSLREFSHLDRAVEESYDLHRGIDSALALLSHLTRGRIEIVREFSELPDVLCKPDAINQVFMNLLQNAVQSIDDRGTIRICTGADGTGRVRVEVSDTGRGISPENLARVFEPGFTTKPRGVGTGLGLAITYSTVSDHGGRIEVESKPGKGTRFSVSLPVGGPS